MTKARNLNCASLNEWHLQENCTAKRAYLRPVTPSTTRLSAVSVPVLSKQQISIFPANGIRNGSVQYTSKTKLHKLSLYNLFFLIFNSNLSHKGNEALTHITVRWIHGVTLFNLMSIDYDGQCTIPQYFQTPPLLCVK